MTIISARTMRLRSSSSAGRRLPQQSGNFRILVIALVVSAVAVLMRGQQAAAASLTTDGYNAYNYDLTTPMFTPDGRLLQVEYAEQASLSWSSPLIAILVPPSTHTSSTINCNENVNVNDPGGIVLACLTNAPNKNIDGTGTASPSSRDLDDNEDDAQEESSSNADKANSISNANTKSKSATCTPTRQQKRIVELRLDHPTLLTERQDGDTDGSVTGTSTQHQHHPPSSRSIMVGLSGILADNLALLRHAQSHVDSWHQSYGEETESG
jgi:hypothetical protein